MKATALPAQSSREKLIESAAILFGQRGFENVSVREIAGGAGVNAAMVGYYFGGKEGLLAQVYARHCDPPKQQQSRILLAYSSRREQSSREKLIASAEKLFGERGFDGVSVREIANEAGVNSALLGYYFRGKEGLLTEIYTRHCEPVKKERLRMLAACTAGGTETTLEQILEAFIRPWLDGGPAADSTRASIRLRAMLCAENSPLLQDLVARNFDRTTRKFVDTLEKCLSHLTREDILWRFHFLLGAISYTGSGPDRIKSLSQGKCDLSDPASATRELIRYAAAGFHAPASAAALSAPPARSRKPVPRKLQKPGALHA